jgi:hypothetical protein
MASYSIGVPEFRTFLSLGPCRWPFPGQSSVRSASTDSGDELALRQPSNQLQPARRQAAALVKTEHH